MESEWCRRTLEAAQDQYGNPEILNTDQGPQYTSKEYSEYVLDQGIQFNMDGVGGATDNAFVERLWRTVTYENVRFSDYSDGLKLCKGMDDFSRVQPMETFLSGKNDTKRIILCKPFAQPSPF